MTTKPTSFQRVWRLLSYLLRLRVRAWDGNKKNHPTFSGQKPHQKEKKTTRFQKFSKHLKTISRNGCFGFFVLGFPNFEAPALGPWITFLAGFWIFASGLKSGIPGSQTTVSGAGTTQRPEQIFWEKRWRSSIFIYPLCWLCSKTLKVQASTNPILEGLPTALKRGVIIGVPDIGKSIHFGLTWPYTQFHVGWPAPKELCDWMQMHIIQKHTLLPTLGPFRFFCLLIPTLAIIAPAASASTQPLISLSQCKNANFLQNSWTEFSAFSQVLKKPPRIYWCHAESMFHHFSILQDVHEQRFIALLLGQGGITGATRCAPHPLLATRALTKDEMMMRYDEMMMQIFIKLLHNTLHLMKSYEIMRSHHLVSTCNFETPPDRSFLINAFAAGPFCSKSRLSLPWWSHKSSSQSRRKLSLATWNTNASCLACLACLNPCRISTNWGTHRPMEPVSKPKISERMNM